MTAKASKPGANSAGKSAMPAKASIQVLTPEGKKKGKPIEVMFNPREYSIARKVDWGSKDSDTQNSSKKTFKGGSAATLTLELFFDTYAHRGSPNEVQDVRTKTQEIWELTKMEEDTNQKRNKDAKKRKPPMVLFTWGKAWFFKAHITNVEQQFTLFMPDGTPVRSIMKVSFEQADNETHFYGSDDPDKAGTAPSTYKLSEEIRNSKEAQDAAKNSTDLRQSPQGRGQSK